MKAYTDLEQSLKLAKFLPLESADNHYWRNGYNNYICGLGNSVELKEKFEEKGIEYLPCWSLAALLDILPRYELNNLGDTMQLSVNREALATEGDETLLDLVVNMIIHLHEVKML